VIAAEPALADWIADADLDEALAAVGEFAELKSPWTMGHARPSIQDRPTSRKERPWVSA
jgi:hypothetical protein